MQTILVIDDDENLRDTIGVLLEREGFRAILAADGKTGLDQAILGKPALILADLRLPDLSGVEICKRLRNSGIQTPIIVLSAVRTLQVQLHGGQYLKLSSQALNAASKAAISARCNHWIETLR